MWKNSDVLKARAAREGRLIAVETAKTSPKRQKIRLWTWQATPAFATIVIFILASSLLFYGSCARLLLYISNNPYLLRRNVLCPYFLGGLLFTIGCAIPLQRTNSQWKLSKMHFKRRQKRSSEREQERARLQQYWAWVDHVGAIIAVSGGLFINAGSYVDFKQGSKAELVVTTDKDELWSITAPVMFGRALFMISGYFAWAARNRSWSMSIKWASVHFWYTTILFWLGASGFYAGWFITDSPFQLLPFILVQNWFGVVAGYIVGSCLLFAASYVMMLELAKPSEVQDLDQALIKV